MSFERTIIHLTNLTQRDLDDVRRHLLYTAQGALFGNSEPPPDLNLLVDEFIAQVSLACDSEGLPRVGFTGELVDEAYINELASEVYQKYHWYENVMAGQTTSLVPKPDLPSGDPPTLNDWSDLDQIAIVENTDIINLNRSRVELAGSVDFTRINLYIFQDAFERELLIAIDDTLGNPLPSGVDIPNRLRETNEGVYNRRAWFNAVIQQYGESPHN